MEISVVFVWFFFGILSAVVASNKGRSGCGWFIIGVLFGPFGFILSLVVSKIEPIVEKRLNSGVTKKCPYCAEHIKYEAIRCRYCGADLVQKISDITNAPDIYKPTILNIPDFSNVANSNAIEKSPQQAAMPESEAPTTPDNRHTQLSRIGWNLFKVFLLLAPLFIIAQWPLVTLYAGISIMLIIILSGVPGLHQKIRPIIGIKEQEMIFGPIKLLLFFLYGAFLAKFGFGNWQDHQPKKQAELAKPQIETIEKVDQLYTKAQSALKAHNVNQASAYLNEALQVPNTMKLGKVQRLLDDIKTSTDTTVIKERLTRVSDDVFNDFTKNEMIPLVLIFEYEVLTKNAVEIAQKEIKSIRTERDILANKAKKQVARAFTFAQIGKATIAAIMGKDPSIMKCKIQGDIAHISYTRANDGTRWKNQVKLVGDRILWRAVHEDGPGRWRDNPLDEVIHFRVEDDHLVIEQRFSDGSTIQKKYTAKEFGR